MLLLGEQAGQSDESLRAARANIESAAILGSGHIELIFVEGLRTLRPWCTRSAK